MPSFTGNLYRISHSGSLSRTWSLVWKRLGRLGQITDLQTAARHAWRCGWPQIIAAANPDVVSCKRRGCKPHKRTKQMPQKLANPPSSPSPDKLQGFIASLPGMACQIELQEDGSFTFPYVSEGCLALFGITPVELQNDASCFLNLIYPEDIPALLDSLKKSAQTLCFWNWEGRIALPGGDTRWISLGATPQSMPNGLPRWEGIVLDTTQSKLGELEVKRVQQQLLELSSHIQDAKEQERLRIAREVHDEIGSLLTAIKMDLSWMIQRLPKESPKLTEKAKTIEELVNRAITSASHLAHRLRPGFLDCFGIIDAIEIEAQEFSKRSGISCTIIKSQESIELPEA